MKMTLSKLAAGVLLCCAGQAIAGPNTFIDLGTLGGGYSTASGINAAGQVAGQSYLSGNMYARAALWNGGAGIDLGTTGGTGHSNSYAINTAGQVAGVSFSAEQSQAVLWTGGVATGLGAAGGVTSRASALNDAGHVVGTIETADGASHAALWANGTTTILSAAYSAASGINNAGQVVGSAYTADGLRAMSWTDGVATDLGGRNSDATAINDAGQIVGSSFTDSGFVHATQWQGGVMVDLDTQNSTQSFASGLNNMSQVVGNFYGNFSGVLDFHAALWSGGTMFDLNSFLDAATVKAGWTLGDARGINDSGWVVGSAFNSYTHDQHAFMLSTSGGPVPVDPVPPGPVLPVPEPESYAMLLAGLALTGCVARRRGSV
ncbi:MAG TPA: hypothetical protein DCW29_21620 [Janthinobacterium sp.]|nr:hypothetical protein [Janthinobacterium sp.]